MLTRNTMPLQHFFIVAGARAAPRACAPRRGCSAQRRSVGHFLCSRWEQHCSEAADITASVRTCLPSATHMGRARAWLRLALMQKKLADYLKVLVDHREDLLAEYYEPDALLMSDEAVVIVGLLVGLNVIDCNLCVKEEDLDCQQGVIDFSLYLRSTNHSAVNSPEGELDQDNMTMVLDQKNYIEELNRHLNATVTNLQAKVEALMTTNALMKEDLAIAKNNILALQEENHSLRVRELPPGGESSPVATNGAPANDEGGGGGGGGNSLSAKELEELRAQLEQERKSRLELEKELDLQVSLKAEMEVAMKLLEQDIHEKQDTIISLRRQLDDIKLINLEMYKKLQECEQELTEKGEMVTRLQAKTTHIGNMLNNLEKFNHLQKDADHKRGGGGRAGGGDGRRIEPIQCHGKSHGSRNGANGSQSASSAASAQQQNKK
ncbi:Uncharacterized protein GBIM_05520 [Gryllus bimaculatus]|nr:Uncharacterized protein GBIM_05520 [Gryllus bimaculatus]